MIVDDVAEIPFSVGEKEYKANNIIKIFVNQKLIYYSIKNQIPFKILAHLKEI